MVYKRFHINLIIRVIILTATIGLFFIIIFTTELFSALFLIGAAFVYQVFSLIRYINKTNRDLTRFFESIRYSDFSQSFKSEAHSSSFSALRTEMSNVLNAFRKARAEKEEHFRYLQTVIQHIGVGLIAFQSNGDIELINTAAKKLLKVPRLKNIKDLKNLSRSLVNTLFQMKPRDKALVKIESEDELLHLALYSTEFKLRGQIYSLVSLQNIHSELEEKEIEAWQKLIRVLTHEIMNSITPISSLASTIKELVRECLPEKEPQEDIQQALQTIQKRTQGLLHFVDAYRNLTHTPKPHFQLFLVRDLFLRVEKLMQANIRNKQIKFTVTVEPETLELTADPEMIDQILINLLLNSLQALKKTAKPKIELKAVLDKEGRILLQVTDNGLGISKENMEKIFIPFFSTKEGGSGIGLSLSRQIMRKHGGVIRVQSEPEKKTIFTLRF